MTRTSRKEEKLRDEYTEKMKKISRNRQEERERSYEDEREEGSRMKESKTATAVKPRKSRWSTEFDRVLIPGLPVALAGVELTQQQLEVYLMQLKIEEISLKLRTGNLGIPVDPEDRSPSPEPAYNTQGVRLNTREIRVRQRLEEERHHLVHVMTERNPEYKPPPDYKIPANKLTDKVFIPQERYPNINFIGLLIGPRGNTLKRLETETNCKIIIRGKGSLKEGKLRMAPMPGEDEPLHALITAPSEAALAKGIATIKRIVKDGIDCPDGNNELRQMQLRELAEINGTFLASEIARCRNCGATDHRHWECTETENFTNTLKCPKCGGVGHLEVDCIYEGEKIVTAEEKAKMDNEYQNLMKELGVSINAASEFPTMMGLPKGLVTDLPWAGGSGSFLNTNDPNFTIGPDGPLAIADTPFYSENNNPQAGYIPGAAPMPSYTVRTLLSQNTPYLQPAWQPAYQMYPPGMPVYPPPPPPQMHGYYPAPPPPPPSMNMPTGNTPNDNIK